MLYTYHVNALSITDWIWLADLLLDMILIAGYSKAMKQMSGVSLLYK